MAVSTDGRDMVDDPNHVVVNHLFEAGLAMQLAFPLVSNPAVAALIESAIELLDEALGELRSATTGR